MFIFKTSGATYDSVIKNQKHAFRGQIKLDWKIGELILVSKNKADLKPKEKQISHVMRLEKYEYDLKGEIKELWPGTKPNRWQYIAHCYDTTKLPQPFNIEEALPIPEKDYKSAQYYTKLSANDEMKVLKYLNGQIDLDKLIKSNNTPTQNTKYPINYERRKAIEDTAVSLATSHYKESGYSVESVEKDNVGWDLNVKKENENLKVEVKGLSGEFGFVELTPNEYAKMQEYKNNYVIFVVEKALEDDRKKHIISYDVDRCIWIHMNAMSNHQESTLQISPVVGARLSIES